MAATTFSLCFGGGPPTAFRGMILNGSSKQEQIYVICYKHKKMIAYFYIYIKAQNNFFKKHLRQLGRGGAVTGVMLLPPIRKKPGF